MTEPDAFVGVTATDPSDNARGAVLRHCVSVEMSAPMAAAITIAFFIVTPYQLVYREGQKYQLSRKSLQRVVWRRAGERDQHVSLVPRRSTRVKPNPGRRRVVFDYLSYRLVTGRLLFAGHV